MVPRGGVYIWVNGNRYDGEWRGDKPDGFGSFTSSGKVYSGIWTNGCFKQGDRWASVEATAKECGFE